MIRHYPAENLGFFETEWLLSRHHFSFGNYHNIERMGFGALRVINDDVIRAGTGFDPHPHRDMEIITFVRAGAIVHRDSLGNEGRTEAGDVQVMSAGTGIRHAEYAQPDAETRIFQIWITPDREGVTPRWEQRRFRDAAAPTTAQMQLLVSGDPADAAQGALFIHHARARILIGRGPAGAQLSIPLEGRPAYLLPSVGSVIALGQTLVPGDGAEITQEQVLDAQLPDVGEFLLIRL